MTATYKPNGNMIISKGAVGSETRTARLKSLAGINVAIIEEAVELTELEFDQLDISLRLKNSDITIVRVFNPPASNHWIWRDYNFVSAEAIFKKFDLPTEYLDKFRTAEPKPGSRVYSFRSDYLDNAANLDDSFLKGVVPRTRERHLESYIINLVGLISVQAFNAVYSWDETSDAEFNNFKFEAEALGIDFGYGEAYTAITHVKMNKTEQRVMIKLLYYQAFSLSRDICKMISDANLLSLICVADSGNGGNYRIAEFRRGIVMEDGSTIELNMVPAMKGPGSILAGIDVVNSYSVEYVSNKFIKEELDNYAYSNLATKELVGVCHALDSARYAIKYLHTNT
jgi:phage terminase large subunit